MDYLILGIVSILFICVLNIICFIVGAKVGQKAVKSEEIKLPNPVRAIQREMQEHEANYEAKKQQEYFSTIDHNISVYNGTSLGQKDIPV